MTLGRSILFSFMLSNSPGVTSMITEERSCPIDGDGPNDSGIIPEGIVFSFTSNRMIGSSGRASSTGDPVTR